MTSINHTVWKLLADDISVQKNIERGIINIRGLARFLIDKHGLHASMDAVISAIRRYETESIFNDKREKIDDQGRVCSKPFFHNQNVYLFLSL